MEGRCDWCGTDPLYQRYHDTEWGVPERDARKLWEMLVLESFQSGLSWITILRKREGFRAAFAGFDPEIVAGWGEADILRLLADAGIVRHRGKIAATIANARAFLTIENGTGGFSQCVWDSVDGRTIVNRPRRMADVAGSTERSARLSKRLRAAGFAFCGPTTVHAFMQAAGLVNDHLVSCPRHGELAALVTDVTAPAARR